MRKNKPFLVEKDLCSEFLEVPNNNTPLIKGETMQITKPWAFAVVGPTASGKSSLALSLAKQVQGEIICMDSMQIYKGMDIGTAKPSKEEQSEVVHHLLDICSPTKNFTVEDYKNMAINTIKQVHAKQKIPILVGGTGLYLQSLAEGMALGGIRSDEATLAKYNEIATRPLGKEKLHAMLYEVDEQSAKKLHCNDCKRVIRALIVYEKTGIPLSKQPKTDSPCQIYTLAISFERALLNSRIEQRVHSMLEQGLVNEVQTLLNNGVSKDMQAMQGIGYKEIIPVINGECSLEEAAALVIKNTKLYAKRQCTWFKNKPNFYWLNGTDENIEQEALSYINQKLALHAKGV